MRENNHQTAQIIGGMVVGENLHQVQQLHEALAQQDVAFAKALAQVEKVRDFVGSPEHILGSSRTKHGEIAEQVEVGIRNARSYLQQHPLRATFKGVGRTAPEDYLIDEVQVQSKFINGVNQSLDHVLKHMNKYEYFGRDGSYYHIAQNHYETIQKVLRGEPVEGLASSTIRQIQQKAQEIEKFSGRSFSEVVKPSISQYSEVQQGKIHETLDRHKQELDSENQRIKQDINKDAQPNLGDMAQVAVKGAAIGAGIRLGFKLYEKHKQGKNFFRGDYTVEDWKEIGIDTAKGGAIGGIAASVIYAATNYANLSAPLAGAFVSAGQSIASLVKSLNSGEISFDEFVEMSLLVTAESAVVTLASVIGQAIIPIPVIGAALGSIAGRIVIDWTKNYLGQEATEHLREQLDEYYTQCLTRIDQTYQAVVSKILAEYEKLGDLTQAVFDVNNNAALILQASVQLAEAYEISESKIIRSIDDLDSFMLS